MKVLEAFGNPCVNPSRVIEVCGDKLVTSLELAKREIPTPRVMVAVEPEAALQAIEQMGRMQRILESHRNEILTKHPRNFAILAEGPLEQIRQLQAQLDEYISRIEGAEAPATR